MKIDRSNREIQKNLIDLSAFDLDDPLLESSLEIYAVQDYYDSMENQIERVQQKLKLKLDTKLKTQNLTIDDLEWHQAYDEYSRWADFLLPRFFRGPFLVSLYALYESVVMEVATAIQVRNPNNETFKNFKKKCRKNEQKELSLLDAYRKYYSSVMKIDLCPDDTVFNKLIILMKLRHAVAHANGRIASLRPDSFRGEIKRIAKENPGVIDDSKYITFGKEFVAEMADMVINELFRFIEENREACRPASLNV